MFGIKNFLFRGVSIAADVPDDVRQGILDWQAQPEPVLSEAHFHVRYVVVDVTTSGNKPESDQLLAISAVGIQRGGAIQPDDAIYIDFSGMENGVAATMETTAGPRVDRQLLAFLQFVAKAPLVTYHSPFVQAFLHRAFKERLGIDFEPKTIDLAWLLPSMFEEKTAKPVPLDQWLNWFEMQSEGRRAAMANTLMLARLFQRLLVRAVNKDIGTAALLLEESSASSFLRRSH